MCEKFFAKLFSKKACRCDEIGRRARLKILCGQPRAGSSPAIGKLNKKATCIAGGFFVHLQWHILSSGSLHCASFPVVILFCSSFTNKIYNPDPSNYGSLRSPCLSCDRLIGIMYLPPLLASVACATVPVLPSHKTILNRFVRQSGHRQIKIYLPLETAKKNVIIIYIIRKDIFCLT